jgi:signal transduction histidine kinase
VPQSTTASLSAAFLLAMAMLDAVPPHIIAMWFGSMCLHQAIRRKQYLRYIRTQTDPPDPAQAARWGRLFVWAATVAGALWGLAPVLLYVPQSIGHQAVLAAVIYGVCATAAAALGSYMPAFIGFVTMMMAPFIARMALVGDATHGFIALAGVLVLLAGIIFGRNINQVLRRSIALRYRNEDLIEALSRQRALAEQARVDAEAANRAKSQFLAAASHDLRQPLHALGLFAAALRERAREPETQALVSNINFSVEALETLFNELLDISRLDAGAVQPDLAHFPLRPMLDRVRLDFGAPAQEKRLRLSVRDSNRWVYSDVVLLERILRNLVCNAVRYTQRGGVIVGCRRRGEFIRIEVWDSGVGVAADQREQIFEEFYRIDDPARHGTKGLGLGLAIIRRLAALLGYGVELESVPGRGSVFSVCVPLGSPGAAHPETIPPVAPFAPGAQGKLVLVVDDELPILDGMRALLQAWGCDVVAGVSGDAALDALGEQSRYPDLIVADYRLQNGETGTQVIARLRAELGSAIPAILVTGTTASELAAEVARADCHLLHKPVAPHELRELIAQKLLWHMP